MPLKQRAASASKRSRRELLRRPKALHLTAYSLRFAAASGSR
jgi:hypothetical protein